MKLIFRSKKLKTQRKIIPIFIPNTKKIVWGHSGLCPWKIPIHNRPGKKFWTQDSDKDGVIDAWDCQPFNKYKQGRQHESELRPYKNEKAFFREMERKYPSRGYVKKDTSNSDEITEFMAKNIENARRFDFGDKLHRDTIGGRIERSERTFERNFNKAKAFEKLNEEYPGKITDKIRTIKDINKPLTKKQDFYKNKFDRLYKQTKKEADNLEADRRWKNKMAWQMMGETKKQRSEREEQERMSDKPVDPDARRKYDERSKIMKTWQAEQPREKSGREEGGEFTSKKVKWSGRKTQEDLDSTPIEEFTEKSDDEEIKPIEIKEED